MLSIFDHFIADSTGAVIAGASVTFRQQESDDPVGLYADAGGTTPTANPHITGLNGRAIFYVAPGIYRVEVTYGATSIEYNHFLVVPVNIRVLENDFSRADVHIDNKISQLGDFDRYPLADEDFVEIIQQNNELEFISKKIPLINVLNEIKPRNLLRPSKYTLTDASIAPGSNIFVDSGYVEIGGQHKAIFTFTAASSKGFIPLEPRRITFLNKSMSGTDYGILVALYLNAVLVTSIVVDISPNVPPANYEITSDLIFNPALIAPSDTISIEVTGQSDDANFIITGYIYDFY
jgi:hypothetical protein